ncbi:universal stress protein [Kitasatospora sp. NPDC001175]|uniref:universal stress protein n=1 Tax=Kitasatospora sp. NPDC001175 TaxID=3157103 RepID=UPI003CFC2D0F
MTNPEASRPVVFGVDARHPGQPALAWAADEAVRRRAPLRMVHAESPFRLGLGGFDGVVSRKSGCSPGEEALDEAVAFATGRHPGLDVAAFLLEGAPAQVLCRQSEEAQLVVLGSRRLNRLEEFLSGGSVAVPVSAQAACAVVVVLEPEDAVCRSPYLVVGADGSRASEAAVDYAFETAAVRGADLHALWVWEPTLLDSADEVLALQKCRRLLFETMAERAERHPDVTVSRQVVRGHPVEELARASEHALAVVVGRRGRGGFTGMRLGSVPHGLLHRAHCPVVTVPTSGRH